MRELRQGQLQKAREEVYALLGNNDILIKQLTSMQARQTVAEDSSQGIRHSAGPPTTQQLEEMLSIALTANCTLQAQLEAYEVPASVQCPCTPACFRAYVLALLA